ncbi:MAG: YcaO-like family protein [Thermodesulfobacteriota bacterium]
MAKIRIEDAVKTHRRDQDKTRSPEKTVEDFFNRIAGINQKIFDRVERVDTGRLGIPVYFSMYGPDARRLTGIRKQMGKGGFDAQARASAVMELVERYSFYAFRSRAENFITGTHEELQDQALPLWEIARSVNDESDEAEDALAFFAQTPQRWCRATDFANDREVLVPFDWFFLINEFNGTSAGNCVAEALCQGFCEVVERHVSALSGVDGVPVPGISRAGITDPVALDLLSRYDKAGILTYLSDFTCGMGIPTVGALCYDPATMGKKSEIVWTAGTSPDPQKALNRALTEVAQLAGDFESGTVYVASGLPKPASLSEVAAILSPASFAQIKDLPDLSDENMAVEAQRLISALSGRGFFPYVVDTTHPEIGLPTFYTLVPGTRFRERSQTRSVALFLARLIVDNGEPSAALKVLLRMRERMAPRHYLDFAVGRSLLALSDLDQARAAFASALTLSPSAEDEATIYVYTAICDKESGEFADALESLRRAEALDKERTDVFNLMGFCHYSLGRYEEAIECFQKVLALDPGSAIDYANIGSNYRNLGDQKKAIEYYRKALALDPGIGFAKKNLITLLMEEEEKSQREGA